MSEAVAFCPYCGARLDDAPQQHVIFDDERRQIVVGHEHRYLSATEWRMLEVLRAHAGKVAPTQLLAAAAPQRYRHGRDDVRAVRQAIYRLRQALDGTPFTIHCELGLGYGLYGASRP